MPKLIVFRGRTKELIKELRGRECVIGRLRSCHLQLEGRLVSRRHARCYLEDDAWFIEDEGTKYGTWYEGEKIQRAAMKTGDVFVIGQHLLLFAKGDLDLDERKEAASQRKRMTSPGTESTGTLPSITVEHLLKRAQLRARAHVVVDFGDGPEGLVLETDRYRIGCRTGCDIRLPRKRLVPAEVVLLRDGLGRWFATAEARGRTRLNGAALGVEELWDGDTLEIGGHTVRFHEKLGNAPV